MLGSEFSICDICWECPSGTPSFRRGDANGDGTVDISDALRTLAYLFGEGRTPACLDAADANDDTTVDIADALFTLFYLFGNGPALPAPGADRCAIDPTESLGCEHYTACQ